MERVYSDDVDIEMLTTKMEILKVLLKDGYQLLCLDDVIVKFKELLAPEQKIINEVITVCKLILVNPATSAAGERSFSTARRLKTWLRLTMTQEQLCNLTILNSHKERTERLSLLDIANEFTDRNINRKQNFGIFKVSDVK